MKINVWCTTGSHLYPSFFIIFINDLANELKFPFKIYAGVLKLYHYIESQIGITVLLEEVDKNK